jgi:hypothetical protein
LWSNSLLAANRDGLLLRTSLAAPGLTTESLALAPGQQAVGVAVGGPSEIYAAVRLPVATQPDAYAILRLVAPAK